MTETTPMSSLREDPRLPTETSNAQQAEEQNINQHLHPLKESTWTEIFPFLAIFDY